MRENSANALQSSPINLKPNRDVVQDPLAPQQVKYQQLSKIDQVHGESLARSCRLALDAKRGSTQLANHSLLQSVVTSLPLLVADFITLWALLFCTTSVVERLCNLPHNLVTHNTALVASLLLVPIARLAGLYPALGTSAAVEFRQIVRSTATALLIFAGIGIGILPTSVNWPYVVAASFLTLLLAVPVMPAARFTVRCFCCKFSWWGAPVLIYAGADIAEELFRRLQSMKERGLRPAAVLLSSEDYWLSSKRLEARGVPAYDVRTALASALHHKAAWVLIGKGGTGGSEPWSNTPDVDVELNAIPNRVLLSSGGFDCGMWDSAQTIGPVCGLLLSNSRHCGSRGLLKRMLDVFVTLSVILVASPVLAGIAIAIWLSSPGPIFYSQRRIGFGGRPFSAWKFRSMLPDADRVLQDYLDNDPELRREWDETHKLKNDPRVTWIGRLLRASSLDELPQLWNILCGDMSLVGPRPIVNSPTYDAAYVNDYPNEFSAYMSVRPGLTGLWQVTCRNSGVYEMRIYWDMYYIRNWSLWLDLYIILRTIRTVIMREGAY